MKKSLLALAVLGAFAGAASAQSSVTVYGSLDLAVTKGNAAPRRTTAPTARPRPGSRSNRTARLGFRATRIGRRSVGSVPNRTPFHPDEGVLNNPSFFWQGRSYVS